MKTSELAGAALDWAVGQATGFEGDWLPDYSTDWEHGGLIIECERISVWARGDEWAAEAFVPNHTGHEETGETPLIAAMRCYVASKLGDEVEVPEELMIHTQEITQ